MPSVTEAAGAPLSPAATLAAGVDQVAVSQDITFTQFTRQVLPLDGFVFWVRSDLLTANPVVPAPTLTVAGSVHYSTEQVQDEAEGFDRNSVTFTASEEVDAFNDIAPGTMWVGSFDGLTFAFSRRSNLYRQEGLFHYHGDALYPWMASQLVTDPAQLDLADVVVSNSLPIWLALNQYMPMFPSFLIPEDVEGPYCAVHIPPEDTRALQTTAWTDPVTGSRYQLAADRVKLTLYGMRSAAVQDFLNYVLNNSVNFDNFGVMNVPVVRDGKRTQAEFATLAQKQTIEFEVSYYQARVLTVAQTFIKSSIVNLIVNED